MANTRFNPTTNGDLHIGHAYAAMVNRYEAHATGGQYILRFDDNTRYWIHAKGGRQAMADIAMRQQEDLDWLGITPDVVAYQSEMEESVSRFLANSRWQNVVDHQPNFVAELRVISDPPIDSGVMWAWITAERVVSDYRLDANLLVRGIELLSENDLYSYYCALFGFPVPAMVYIPRLMTAESEDLASVSKTRGNWKIRDLRERGCSPALIVEALATSCLIDVRGPWSLDNLKTRPVLSQYAMENL